MMNAEAASSHPKATPRPTDSQRIATRKPPSCDPHASPKPPQSHLQATPGRRQKAEWSRRRALRDGLGAAAHTEPRFACAAGLIIQRIPAFGCSDGAA